MHFVSTMVLVDRHAEHVTKDLDLMTQTHAKTVRIKLKLKLAVYVTRICVLSVRQATILINHNLHLNAYNAANNL